MISLSWLRATLLFLAALLAGCNTPSPHFDGRPALRVMAGGHLWEVRRKGRLAEAIRVDRTYAPRVGPLGGSAEAAIRMATGCDVARLRGDAAMMVARLKCPKAPR